MWVIFKETYAGTLGMFVKGQKIDLPKEKVAAIRKAIGDKNVIDICAPWEEKTDRNAIKHNEFLVKVHAVTKKAESLMAECEQLVNSIKELNLQLISKQKDTKNAIDKAKKLTKTAGIDWPPKTGEDAGKS